MKPAVVISPQVRDYLRSLSPADREALQKAIMSAPAGDVRPLEESLDGFLRLRAGRHRIVFALAGGQVRCIHAAPRSLILEYCAAHVNELLGA